MREGSLHGRSRGGVLAAVVVVHLAALWWLQAGLSRESLPRVLPVSLISVVPEVPTVVSVPLPVTVPPVAPRSPPPRAETPTPVIPVNRPPVAVQPAPVPERTAPSMAPAILSTPTVPGPSTAVMPAAAGESAAPARAPVVPSAAPAPALVLPTAQAAYLHNPPPAYPAISRRLGEQGRVVVRVWIGVDGGPQKAEIQSGSGYDRLDRVALQTVMGWRFVPGRRGDVPEAMWVSVPIQFQLE